MFWEDYGFEPKNWKRVTFDDKGYGYFRTYMDNGVTDAKIIKLIRYMYLQKVSDSRELFGGEDSENYEPQFKKFMGNDFHDWMLFDPLYIKWTSVARLKKFSGSYIYGGGRHECLKEVQLLMNAFNIKYKEIKSLIYG